MYGEESKPLLLNFHWIQLCLRKHMFCRTLSHHYKISLGILICRLEPILYYLLLYFLKVWSRTPQIAARLGRTIANLWVTMYNIIFTAIASQPTGTNRRVTVTTQPSKLNISCIDKLVYGDSYLTIDCYCILLLSLK